MRKGLVAAVLLGMMGCQPAGVTPSGTEATTLLRAEPSRVDLGTVKPGSRHEVQVKITNPGLQVVTITRLESSCECLTLELPKQTWQPGETVTGKLVVDLSKEPEFQGAVRMTVMGQTSATTPVLKVECDLEGSTIP